MVDGHLYVHMNGPKQFVTLGHNMFKEKYVFTVGLFDGDFRGNTDMHTTYILVYLNLCRIQTKKWDFGTTV